MGGLTNKINEHTEIMTGHPFEAYPRNLGEMNVRINAIADAINNLADKGRTTKGTARDKISLIDLWDYVEKGMGVRASLAKHNDMPRTDPLTMIDAAKRYGVVAPGAADRLRDEFMRKASAAAGIDLNEAQLKALGKLFNNYDPVEKLRF